MGLLSFFCFPVVVQRLSDPTMWGVCEGTRRDRGELHLPKSALTVVLDISLAHNDTHVAFPLLCGPLHVFSCGSVGSGAGV